MDRAALTSALAEWGEPSYRARQAVQAQRAGAGGWDEVTVLPVALRSRLADELPFWTLTPEARVVSRDGTVKWGLRAADGAVVEAVLIALASQFSGMGIHPDSLDDAPDVEAVQAGCLVRAELGGAANPDVYVIDTGCRDGVYDTHTLQTLAGAAGELRADGYNAFWRDCTSALPIGCDGFEVETLMNIRAVKVGLRVSEVPSYERERRHGLSNLNAARDGMARAEDDPSRAAGAGRRPRDRSRSGALRASRDPSTSLGRVAVECEGRCLSALGLDPRCLRPLRLLAWIVHARAEYDRLALDGGGRPTPRALDEAVFVRLWREDLTMGDA